MYKTILFDLDNTLLDFDIAENNALKRTLEDFQIEPSDFVMERYRKINEKQWRLLEQEKLSIEEVKYKRFEVLFEELRVDGEYRRAAEQYLTYLGMEHYFIEGAEKVLKEYSIEYSLYLVTNGMKNVQKGRLQSADMEKYFQNIFISEDIGYDKPSARYFEYCFGHISNFRRDETIIIGDSLTSDIQGGINAGIKTVWFNPKYKLGNIKIIPDYEIHALQELNTIL